MNIRELLGLYMKNMLFVFILILTFLFPSFSYSYTNKDNKEIIWDNNDFNMDVEELNSQLDSFYKIIPLCIGGYLFIRVLGYHGQPVQILTKNNVNPSLHPVQCRVKNLK